MHGVQELNQGVRELCVNKYQTDKFWDFVMAANEKCDYTNVDTCWEQVAKYVGVKTEQIKTCQNDEAVSLLEEEIKLNAEYEASGSPTIILNGEAYTGSRTPEAFKQAVCSSFNNAPEACSQILDDSGATAEGSCN